MKKRFGNYSFLVMKSFEFLTYFMFRLMKMEGVQDAFSYLFKTIFSHKNFLILNKCIYVVKIKNKRKLKVYLKDYDSGSISQDLAAKYLGITPRWFRHIYKIYKSTGPYLRLVSTWEDQRRKCLKNGRKLSSRNMKCLG